MKAIIRVKGGKDLSTMKVREIDSIEPLPDQVKVRMSASRINPVDMDLMKGMPFLNYKNPQIGGVDGAGVIIEIGANVKNFKIGDSVYFYKKFTDIGTWAEEVNLNTSDIFNIPNNMTVLQVGSITLPLITAYDSIIQLNVQKGEKILIHGAGGGVGFQAVQIAKQLGLYILATASSSDKEVLLSAGVDQVIDYKTEQFEKVISPRGIDYCFDVVGGENLIKSISLCPKKLISVHYMEPDKMDKVGMKLHGILKWIIRLSMRKYDIHAKKNNVQLIGQVTAANAVLLQSLTEFVNKMSFINRECPTRTLEDIELNGLNKLDLGKVILF